MKNMYQPFMYWRGRQVFDDLKCIYVHVPKNGGASIRLALVEAAGGRKGRLFGGHTSILEYKTRLEFDKFEEYFKFGFFRNPMDRAMSAYLYLKKCAGGQFKKFIPKGEVTSFEVFCNKVLLTDRHLVLTHTRPQHMFLCDDEMNICVDFVGRFDRLQKDFHTVCDKLGVKRISLPHRNRSIANKPKISKSCRKIIETVYKKDFKVFEKFL